MFPTKGKNYPKRLNVIFGKVLNHQLDVVCFVLPSCFYGWRFSYLLGGRGVLGAFFFGVGVGARPSLLVGWLRDHFRARCFG